MNLLEDRQLASFRKEYLEREKEIQRYIGVYLSGIVIVFGWIIGPQSRGLNEMALGNDGYNIYGFLIIAVVNAVFITFLIYKSLDIHDTTQFMTVYAKPESMYTLWERWRRSDYSITKPVRTGYFVALALLPTVMALLLLVFVASKIFATNDSLRTQLIQMEINAKAGHSILQTNSNLQAGATATPPAPTAAATETTEPPDVSRRLVHTGNVFWIARFFFALVILLHGLPTMFFYRNAGHTAKQWQTIVELKNAQKSSVSTSSEASKLQAFLEDRPSITEVVGATGQATKSETNQTEKDVRSQPSTSGGQ